MNTSSNKIFDLLILGHSHIELNGEQIGSSLKETFSFQKFVGGSATNIAIGCSRLKLNCALICTVGNDQMGETILETLTKEKIDIRHIQITPNPSPIALQNASTKEKILYNENYANLSLAELDLGVIAKSQALLITSDYFSNTNNALVLQKALKLAKKNQTKVIFLIEKPDYQSLDPFLSHCDLLLGSESDYQLLTGFPDTGKALTQLRTLTSATLVMLRSPSCHIYTHAIPKDWQNSPSFHKAAQAIEQKEAFISGFLEGCLRKKSLEKCCEQALACETLAKLKNGLNTNLPSLETLTLYLADQQKIVSQPAKTAYFSHIYYATTLYTQPNLLQIFSLGYHHQWIKMANLSGSTENSIPLVKNLIVQGLQAVDYANQMAGVILDDYSSHSQQDLQGSPLHFLARTIEMPEAIPLQFNTHSEITDITHTLRFWPKTHIVKVSVLYHPDDHFALRVQQENTLKLLHSACRASGHQLLIEITPHLSNLNTASTMAHIMSRFYECGIYPDWWQIHAPRDQRSWDSIHHTLEKNDPYCQGVLVYAPLASLEQLSPIFQLASEQKYCRGFIAGRGILHQPLEQWFTHKITDESFIHLVTTQFQQAMLLWACAQKKEIVSKDNGVRLN